MADITAKLLRVYRCDQRVDGLQARLKAAERFLAEQVKQVGLMDQQAVSIRGQLRQLEVAAAGEEGEASRLRERAEAVKKQMNAASNAKQYQQLLTEVKNLESKRDDHDKNALEHMEKLDVLRAKLKEIEGKLAERAKVRDLASGERTQRADEIRDKLNELLAERKTLAADVPPDALKIYEDLRRERGEDAMAPLEVIDHRRHEYICGSSQMSVPVEVANRLIKGQLTLSPNNGCILYLSEEALERMTTSSSSRG